MAGILPFFPATGGGDKCVSCLAAALKPSFPICSLGPLEGAILLPPPPQCRESRHAPPGLAYVVLGMELSYSPSH